MYFDYVADLLRSLPAQATRRDALIGLTSVLGGLVPASLRRDEAAAGGSGKRKRRRKRRRPRSRCRPNCAGKTCGDNGCGGSCGGCLATQACQSGNCVCACPAGQVCLSNESCATVCPSGCDTTCGCSDPSAEGPQHCVPLNASCETAVQSCTSTIECPLGQHCQETGCGPGGSIERRCVTLCSS
jgi:hypothetical protein